MYRVIKNIIGYFWLLLIGCVIFSGCPISSPSRNIQTFGWSRDGSQIIAVVNDFGKPDYAQEVITYNLLGEEQSKVVLPQMINDYNLGDRLFFSDKSNSFFVQIGMDIYLVNSKNGNETLLLPNHNFIKASQSGKVIFTMLNQEIAELKDTDTYALHYINGETIRMISNIKMPKKVTFNPDHSNMVFLSDSLWVACYADSSHCSLTIYDTLFRIRYSANDGKYLFLPSYSEVTNELVYISDSYFYTFNIPGLFSKQISPARSHTYFLDTPPSSAFITYTISGETRDFYGYLNSIRLYNLRTNQDTMLSDVAGSIAQFSPDGKHVAYFTRENRDFQLHVVPVP